jgi:hypothetical protein
MGDVDSATYCDKTAGSGGFLYFDVGESSSVKHFFQGQVIAVFLCKVNLFGECYLLAFQTVHVRSLPDSSLACFWKAVRNGPGRVVRIADVMCRAFLCPVKNLCLESTPIKNVSLSRIHAR